MSKIETKNQSLEQQVMEKIRTQKIVMKPRWYYVLGSVLLLLGFVGASIAAIFMANLSLFFLRAHGPMGQVRLELMIQNFPWWIPILALLGLVSAVIVLKRYDFSYKKNFSLIVTGFVLSLLLAAWLIDATGINDYWIGQGRMMRRGAGRLTIY